MDSRSTPDISSAVSRTGLARTSGDYLVIYPTGITTPLIFIDSYLSAAEAIIGSFKEKSLTAPDDELAIPLMNLYINVVEFSLKYLIERLDEHRQLRKVGICDSVRDRPNNYTSVLYTSHDVRGLVDVASQMLPADGSMHEFPAFAPIGAYFCSLFDLGINSESTRYMTDSKGKTHPLYDEQTWVDPRLLHRDLAFMCRTIVGYADGDEMYLCGSREFSS